MSIDTTIVVRRCVRCGDPRGARRAGESAPFRDEIGRCAACSSFDEAVARGEARAKVHAAAPADLSAFAILLRQHVERQRLSQERLAEQCKLDHSLISRLRSGQREPTRESLSKLCAGLALPPNDADQLWLSAGMVPPDLGTEEMGAAVRLIRAASAAEIDLALGLIAAVRHRAA